MARQHNRTFFSRIKAEAFVEEIKNQGGKAVQITQARDAFKQTQYRVEWNTK